MWSGWAESGIRWIEAGSCSSLPARLGGSTMALGVWDRADSDGGDAGGQPRAMPSTRHRSRISGAVPKLGARVPVVPGDGTRGGERVLLQSWIIRTQYA